MTDRNIGLTAATTASRTATPVIVVDPLTGMPSAYAPYPPYPGGATPVIVVGNGANSQADALMPAVSGKTNYISGFEITGLGATSAGSVAVVVTGVLGGTMTYIMGIPAGATVALTPLIVSFNPPLPGSAVNTALNVQVPAAGTGNTSIRVVNHGFVV